MAALWFTPLFIPLAASAFAADAPNSAASSAFPSKPIRFILGYPPGGASDAVARLLVAPLTAGSRG
jgi:tripartite-type tricarboxylate transporter receptor subunit TctC